jgi:hypothetical protein
MSERFVRGTAACALVGGMAHSVPGATGFVALAHRAVINMHDRKVIRDAEMTELTST